MMQIFNSAKLLISFKCWNALTIMNNIYQIKILYYYVIVIGILLNFIVIKLIRYKLAIKSSSVIT